MRRECERMSVIEQVWGKYNQIYIYTVLYTPSRVCVV